MILVVSLALANEFFNAASDVTHVLLLLTHVWLTDPDFVHLGLSRLSRAQIRYSPPFPPHLKADELVTCWNVKSIHSL
jgi:hypothetical protein